MISDAQFAELAATVDDLQHRLDEHVAADTLPPPPDTLHDTDDLTRQGQIARALTDIQNGIGASFVPLRTDIETLSCNIQTLTGTIGDLAAAINTIVGEVGTLKARVETLEAHVGLK